MDFANNTLLKLYKDTALFAQRTLTVSTASRYIRLFIGRLAAISNAVTYDD